jgi:uncharacterized 2Fe-2S/4Fe-4S cluster protein (DUF4445 family)
MKTCTVTLYPEGRRQTCEPQTLLLDVLAEAGTALRSPCGGKGICGKCAVTASGNLSGKTGAETGLFPESRLSCQAIILGDVEVHLEKGCVPAACDIPTFLDRFSSFGIALDIGTTRIQMSLIDLRSGEIWRVDSFVNPQHRYGHDVIARISAGAYDGAYLKLVQLLRLRLQSAISDLLCTYRIPPGRFEKMALSGNTAMMHFLYGLEVEPLGLYPYKAQTLDYDTLPPPISGLPPDFSPSVMAFPSASAYLGGDLVGGLALCRFLGLTRNTLFLDMGTNGEMFLADGEGRIFATSCAMGPALEGMNISRGMTAETGAICRIGLESATVSCHVLGDCAPAGICGTGLIDAVALLLDTGILLPSGAFSAQAPELASRIGLHYEGTDPRTLYLAGGIGISQGDIRNFQLARTACLAACTMMLSEAGYAVDGMRDVVISGAFGEKLDIANFKRLGFLPPMPNAGYRFAGNTSLAAAEAACLDQEFYETAKTLRDEIKVLDLSADPRFFETFTSSLRLE